jgi:hypothetical protein
VEIETLVSNTTGDVREEFLGGRKYLVAPVTLIVPGVLNGSNGPLYYPESEVKQCPWDWNGFPITKGHPTLNGSPTSARDPEILEQFGLGYVFRGNYQNKLQGEAWFDDEHTKVKAPDTYARLVAKEKIEVSTGLFLRQDPAPQGAAFNGKPYTHVASKYRPDHLAVIENGVGACSCDDGCGVFNAGRDGHDLGWLTNVPVGEEFLVNAEPLDLVANPMPHYHAARIQSPDQFEKESFRTKQLAPGIYAVMAKHGKNGSMMIQSYRFAATKFTAEQAKAWLKKHHVKDMGFEPATAKESDKSANNRGQDPTPAPEVTNELSHDQIRSQLSQLMRAQCSQADPYCYVEYVFDDYFIYSMGGELYRQTYSKSDAGVTLGSEDPVEVTPKVTFTPRPEENMAAISSNQRQEIVTFLTTNCDCWKPAGSDKVLNALSDEQLVSLHNQAKSEIRRREVENAAKKGFGLSDDATTDQVVNALNAHKPAPAPAPPTGNSESRLTPDEKAAVDWALGEQARVRNELVSQLTANVADGAEKAQAQAIYQGMTIDNLRALARAMPPAVNADPSNGLPRIPVPMFAGASAPQAVNNGQVVNTEPLEEEPIDWTENASERMRKRLGR